MLEEVSEIYKVLVEPLMCEVLLEQTPLWLASFPCLLHATIRANIFFLETKRKKKTKVKNECSVPVVTWCVSDRVNFLKYLIISKKHQRYQDQLLFMFIAH